MNFFNGFKFSQEKFETIDFLIVCHEIRLEVKVVSLRNRAMFGLYNLLNSLKKLCIKFLNDVTVSKLFESSTELPNFFH